jgi:hypothetical protein
VLYRDGHTPAESQNEPRLEELKLHLEPDIRLTILKDHANHGSFHVNRSFLSRYLVPIHILFTPLTPVIGPATIRPVVFQRFIITRCFLAKFLSLVLFHLCILASSYLMSMKSLLHVTLKQSAVEKRISCHLIPKNWKTKVRKEEEKKEKEKEKEENINKQDLPTRLSVD